MRYIVLFLGIMLLLYGCLDYFRFEPAGPPQQVNGTSGGTSAPPSTQSTCSDGTSINSCSSTKPMYCTASQTLEQRASLCGCPVGFIMQGDSCISQCTDGTSLDRCSRTKPKFCNQYGQLVDKASMCGCPELSVRSGEICAPACQDGTLPGECSATKPSYCSESRSLISNPSECGCPAGQVLQSGQCKAAKCIDDTPVGGCSTHMLPTYCDETLTLVRNPRVCGCLSGEILSEDKSQCLNPDALSYDEGDKFKVFDEAYMRIDQAEWVECATGDFIRIRLQLDNSDSTTAYPLSETEFKLFMREHSSQTGTWVSVEYPSHDGLCAEDDKFAWTYTMDGDVNTGMVWFRLPGPYDSGLEYSVYYRGMRVEISP
ncbi:hypothetical protein H0O01_04040 [Candidatus Micrarchaeota archaeon]|nr:hypothetical protein [Candidatus Micrarchaeota archaeon]